MNTFKLFSSAAAVALVAAATPAMAQVASPDWVIEGPIQEITANTIKVMGVTIQVPEGKVDTPTKAGVPLIALKDAMPGRPDGFIGGTAIVTAGSDHGTVTVQSAQGGSVFSDLSENVLVGEVSSVKGAPLEVNGIKLEAIGETHPVMPSLPIKNIFGFKVNQSTIDQWSLISVEGYLGTDDKLYYWAVEADTGDPTETKAEVSILRAQCRNRAGTNRDELEVRGAVHPSAGQFLPTAANAIPSVTLEYLDGSNPARLRTATVRPVAVAPTAPATAPFYGEYRFTASNLSLSDCPLKVTAKWQGDSETELATIDADAEAR